MILTKPSCFIPHFPTECQLIVIASVLGAEKQNIRFETQQVENYSQSDLCTSSLSSVERLRASIMNKEEMNIHEGDSKKINLKLRKI